MSLKDKAKTIVQLRRDHDEWIKTFREGAMGNQGAYNLARDTRKYFEEEKWLPLTDILERVLKLRDYIQSIPPEKLTPEITVFALRIDIVFGDLFVPAKERSKK